jgi:putative ABC transport system permease protein
MAPPVGTHEIVLTHTAAAQLDAVVGAPLLGVVARRRDGEAEAQRLPLTVRGVLPETAFGRDAAFVSLPLLVALEDYRDGFAVAELGVDAGTPARAGARPFASARLYARELDDVAPLADRLRGEGIEVVTRAREIETVKAIDRTLTLLFTVLAAIATVGYVVSLAASLWASVDRKRREIALLRLVGLGTAAVIGFPAVQAALVAAGGLLLSVAAYGGVAAIFNWTFATYLGREELVCALRLRHIAIAAGLTLACALGASIFGGYRATRIDPAESLREL